MPYDSESANEEKEYYSLVEKVFAVLAPFYDAATFMLSGTRKRVVAIANARPDARILDVATGTGKQAFAFAERGYQVVGVDLSEAMLRVANRKNKYHNLKFQTADATKLPFRDDSFDVSCVSFALHDMPPAIRERVLREVARVTKTDGTIMIVDYALPTNKLGGFLSYHFVRLYEREYYARFIRTDLPALLGSVGITIKEELE